MIDSFTGEHAFLSNFHPSPIGEIPTAEHAYQACKTLDPVEVDAVYAASTPGKAKRAGQKVTMRPNWDAIKLDVMLKVLRCKFEYNPALAAQLVETYPHDLVEGNHWNDTYWGVCKGEGQNWLGRLLMVVRSGLMADES